LESIAHPDLSLATLPNLVIQSPLVQLASRMFLQLLERREYMYWMFVVQASARLPTLNRHFTSHFTNLRVGLMSCLPMAKFGFTVLAPTARLQRLE
jgi:hypothetical protein